MDLAAIWQDRIAPRIVEIPSGCWEWPGTKARGYGQLKVAQRKYLVHRISAAVHLGLDYGDPRQFACHRCDNKPCFRPDHLFVGDNRANVLDALAKGMTLPGAPQRERCQRGHLMAVTRVRKPNGNTRCSVCEKAQRAAYRARSRA